MIAPAAMIKIKRPRDIKEPVTMKKSLLPC